MRDTKANSVKVTRSGICRVTPILFLHEARYMAALHLHEAEKLPHLAQAKTRILVIDDDASVGTAIKAILTRHQCETALASRAHAGIHAFLSRGFDVVIVDLFMPGMNGLDTIARIRKQSAVPIIAMSGFRLRNSLDADQDFLGMAIIRGASLSLCKPFSSAQLIAAIDRSRSAPAAGESTQ